jgi:hypothetical protein
MPAITQKIFALSLVVVAAAMLAATAWASDVVIHNPSWNQVSIEVRVGNAGDCDQNRPYNTFHLARGGAATVTTNGEDVCWRRETDPDHPNGQWTIWTRQSVGSPTSHYDVNV